MLYWILLVCAIGIFMFFMVTPTHGAQEWRKVVIIKYKPYGLDVEGISLIASLVLFIGVVISPAFWEFPLLDQEVVLIREDLSMARSRFFGVPDLPWGDDQVVNLSLKPQMGKVVVQPVTANPKVRHLISVVDARIVNTKLYLLEVPEACTRKGWEVAGLKLYGGNILVNEIESALYEFHEKYSVALGEFYNPHDSAQQAMFSKLPKFTPQSGHSIIIF